MPMKGPRAAADQAGERGADLVDEWVARKNVAAVLEIAMDDGAPTLVRKAARRGINVLKSRGVPIPEPPRQRAMLPAPHREVTSSKRGRPPARRRGDPSAFTLGSRSPQGPLQAGRRHPERRRGARVDCSDADEPIAAARHVRRHRQALRPSSRFRAHGLARCASLRRASTRRAARPFPSDSNRTTICSARPPPRPGLIHRPFESARRGAGRGARLFGQAPLGTRAARLASRAACDPNILNDVGREIRAEGAAEPGLAQRKVREVIEKATDSFFSRAERLGLVERMKDAASRWPPVGLATEPRIGRNGAGDRRARGRCRAAHRSVLARLLRESVRPCDRARGGPEGA